MLVVGAPARALESVRGVPEDGPASYAPDHFPRINICPNSVGLPSLPLRICRASGSAIGLVLCVSRNATVARYALGWLAARAVQTPGGCSNDIKHGRIMLLSR